MAKLLKPIKYKYNTKCKYLVSEYENIIKR